MAAEPGEIRRPGERLRSQVERPGGDDRAAPPHLPDIGYVDRVAEDPRSRSDAVSASPAPLLAAGIRTAVQTAAFGGRDSAARLGVRRAACSSCATEVSGRDGGPARPRPRSSGGNRSRAKIRHSRRPRRGGFPQPRARRRGRRRRGEIANRWQLEMSRLEEVESSCSRSASRRPAPVQAVLPDRYASRRSHRRRRRRGGTPGRQRCESLAVER
jgi:hypothetical protein